MYTLLHKARASRYGRQRRIHLMVRKMWNPRDGSGEQVGGKSLHHHECRSSISHAFLFDTPPGPRGTRGTYSSRLLFSLATLARLQVHASQCRSAVSLLSSSQRWLPSGGGLHTHTGRACLPTACGAADLRTSLDVPGRPVHPMAMELLIIINPTLRIARELTFRVPRAVLPHAGSPATLLPQPATWIGAL